MFNNPAAVRDHNEKLGILEFPQFIAPTLATRDPAAVHAFIDEHRDVILKRLDGMGGESIFRVRQDDPNRNVIVETMVQAGARSIMAQRYIPEITKGDKRILLIDGKPVPHSLARIAKLGETRANLAAGGRGVAQPLSARDREIAGALGPVLAARGLLLVGLDVIGDYLTEVNVTSPTCFREIQDQTGFDVAGNVFEFFGTKNKGLRHDDRNPDRRARRLRRGADPFGEPRARQAPVARAPGRRHGARRPGGDPAAGARPGAPAGRGRRGAGAHRHLWRDARQHRAQAAGAGPRRRHCRASTCRC